jgi:hypothetical protein
MNEVALAGTNVVGKCFLYNNLCKMLCEEILREDDCPIGESGYCFWLRENLTSSIHPNGACKNKV